MKLYLIALALLIAVAGISHARDLERPREALAADGALPPPRDPARPPIESAGDAPGDMKPAPAEIQLLSGPSSVPLGLLLLGLAAGRLVGREG